MPAEWLVDATTLRSAAEASRGTHDSDGAIVHTVDYPYQLLSALESSTFSVEADVTVIDGTGLLQLDPQDPVGMPLLEFLEYAATAEFPIVKLDLKRDRVGQIMDEVQQAIDRFGLDPRRLHFNADVFRGPGVENDIFGARQDLSSTDSMYNRVVMELETSDLIEICGQFPESTIVISATTPTDPSGGGTPRTTSSASSGLRRNPSGQPRSIAGVRRAGRSGCTIGSAPPARTHLDREQLRRRMVVGRRTAHAGRDRDVACRGSDLLRSASRSRRLTLAARP